MQYISKPLGFFFGLGEKGEACHQEKGSWESNHHFKDTQGSDWWNNTAGRAAAEEELSFKGWTGLSSNGAHVSQRIHLLHCDRHAKALNVVAPHVHNFNLFFPLLSSTQKRKGVHNFTPIALFSPHVSDVTSHCESAVSLFLQGQLRPRACPMRNGPARLPLVFSLCHGPRRRRRRRRRWRCQFYNSVKGN